MCIRDRRREVLRDPAGDLRRHLGGLGQLVRPARRAEPHAPCLLYTSDAADDLLCVDLGGRRIIQKKRH